MKNKVSPQRILSIHHSVLQLVLKKKKNTKYYILLVWKRYVTYFLIEIFKIILNIDYYIFICDYGISC